MNPRFLLRAATLAVAALSNVLARPSSDLYLTNAVVLSDGRGQFGVQTPDATKPYALLYSFAKDFCYLPGEARWEVLMALPTGADRHLITLPEPMSTIGTMFFRAAPLGQPIYWLKYTITTYGTLSGETGVVAWPKQPDGWDVQLTMQNSTNFPPASEVLFTGPAGAFTGVPAQSAEEDWNPYAWYYCLSQGGSVPPGGTWFVRYGAQTLTLPKPDPQANHRYVVMVPRVAVSGGLLTSVSWTYCDPANGQALSTVPDDIVGSASVTVSTGTGHDYDSPPGDRTRTHHVFSSPIVWSDVRGLGIGFHDNLGNRFAYHYRSLK